MPTFSNNYLVTSDTNILPYSPLLSSLFAITTSLPYISYLTISVPITPPIILPYYLNFFKTYFYIYSFYCMDSYSHIKLFKFNLRPCLFYNFNHTKSHIRNITSLNNWVSFPTINKSYNHITITNSI